MRSFLSWTRLEPRWPSTRRRLRIHPRMAGAAQRHTADRIPGARIGGVGERPHWLDVMRRQVRGRTTDPTAVPVAPEHRLSRHPPRRLITEAKKPIPCVFSYASRLTRDCEFV
jgi:hypothetical protein